MWTCRTMVYPANKCPQAQTWQAAQKRRKEQEIGRTLKEQSLSKEGLAKHTQQPSFYSSSGFQFKLQRDVKQIAGSDTRVNGRFKLHKPCKDDSSSLFNQVIFLVKLIWDFSVPFLLRVELRKQECLSRLESSSGLFLFQNIRTVCIKGPKG